MSPTVAELAVGLIAAILIFMLAVRLIPLVVEWLAILIPGTQTRPYPKVRPQLCGPGGRFHRSLQGDERCLHHLRHLSPGGAWARHPPAVGRCELEWMAPG